MKIVRQVNPCIKKIMLFRVQTKWQNNTVSGHIIEQNEGKISDV